MRNVELLVKGANLLRSCETPEQFAVAEKYNWLIFDRLDCSQYNLKDTNKLWNEINKSIKFIREQKGF